MESKIVEILREIKEEIVSYAGDNMLEEGVIDSFDVIDIMSSLEEQFDIEIDAEYAVAENFANKETIIKMMKVILCK